MPIFDLWKYTRTVHRHSMAQRDDIQSFSGVFCASLGCVYVVGGDVKFNGIVNLSELQAAIKGTRRRLA